ncbi:MAG TPA: response regulator transcription factor [Desulfobacterales bacterium]|nr:response regulator transcription factor [Desulfobacterales bacterium]
MESKKQIFIVEDHRLFREGLKAMLSLDPGYEIIGEAEDGLEAVRLIRKAKPDLVLLDLSMPRMNGFSVLREIKGALPEIKVLVLSIHESDQYVLQAFEAKADGYAIKDSSREELRVAIRSVLEGKKYISPGVAGNVLEGYLDGRKTLKSKSAFDTVTEREKEILKLLGEGYQNKEIADLVHISVKTVEKHRANIMAKLDLHNAAALTAFAFEHGLITTKT